MSQREPIAKPVLMSDITSDDDACKMSSVGKGYLIALLQEGKSIKVYGKFHSQIVQESQVSPEATRVEPSPLLILTGNL